MPTDTLADTHELSDLIGRLGLWLDGETDDEPTAIFTDDVTAQTPGGTAEGLEAVVAQARRNHELTTHHLLTNVLSQVEGDEAKVRANLLATFVEAGGNAPQYTMGARYGFEARRTPEGWRLSRIEVSPVWAQGTRPGG